VKEKKILLLWFISTPCTETQRTSEIKCILISRRAHFLWGTFCMGLVMICRNLCKILGSHGSEYEDESRLGFRPCSLIGVDWHCILPHHHDDEGSMHLWNIILLQDYTALYPRRLFSSYHNLCHSHGSNIIREKVRNKLRTYCNQCQIDVRSLQSEAKRRFDVCAHSWVHR
jgi:hypothetical protein